jgi:hypothetical protein
MTHRARADRAVIRRLPQIEVEEELAGVRCAVGPEQRRRKETQRNAKETLLQAGL